MASVHVFANGRLIPIIHSPANEHHRFLEGRNVAAKRSAASGYRRGQIRTDNRSMQHGKRHQ